MAWKVSPVCAVELSIGSIKRTGTEVPDGTVTFAGGGGGGGATFCATGACADAGSGEFIGAAGAAEGADASSWFDDLW